jgi:type IV secretory pathway VirB2 component (pilin)
MGIGTTVAVLLVALALAGFANWQERRPRPYMLVQIVAIVVLVLMAAHLVSLLTGQQLTSRFLS